MELLIQLYKITSKSGREDKIKSFLLDSLKDIQLKIETDSISNLFITKGQSDIYPCRQFHHL